MEINIPVIIVIFSQYFFLNKAFFPTCFFSKIVCSYMGKYMVIPFMLRYKYIYIFFPSKS